MQGIDRASVETWLAAVLMEHQPAWPCAPGEGVEAVIDISNAEGVAALLQARLQASGLVVPDALHVALDDLVRIKAAQSLYRQAHGRAILARLESAQIPVLVLKGSALAYWAYAAPHLRECSDIDLLFPDIGVARQAAEVIAPLGYTRLAAASAGDLVDFEMTCVRGTAGERLEVDIHWHLSNAPVFAFRFGWAELWADSMPLPSLAPSARGLAPVPAFLHACMHRVQNIALGGPDRMKWLYDLVVLARGFGEAEWSAVAAQATARGLADTCADSLRAAEARFGAFAPAAVVDALMAAARREPMRVQRLRSWWYFQRMDWRAFPGTRMRWRWLRQRLLPDAAYLRERHGARGGVAGALWRRLLSGLRRLRN
jgi:hypothetical protein